MDSDAMQAEIDDLDTRLRLVEALLQSVTWHIQSPDMGTTYSRYSDGREAAGLDREPEALTSIVQYVDVGPLRPGIVWGEPAATGASVGRWWAKRGRGDIDIAEHVKPPEDWDDINWQAFAAAFEHEIRERQGSDAA